MITHMHIGADVHKVLAIATPLGHSGSASETAPAFRTGDQDERNSYKDAAHANERHSPP